MNEREEGKEGGQNREQLVQLSEHRSLPVLTLTSGSRKEPTGRLGRGHSRNHSPLSLYRELDQAISPGQLRTKRLPTPLWLLPIESPEAYRKPTPQV